MVRKLVVAVLAVAVLVFGAGLCGIAQQPYQLTPMNEAKRDRAVSMAGGKYHVLPATLDTTQWDWLDPSEKPKVVINSPAATRWRSRR